MTVSLTKPVSLEKTIKTAEQLNQLWRARNSRLMPIEFRESERECYVRLYYIKQR